MGAKTEAVGGGAATGVSKDFLDILRRGISGEFGAGTDPNSVMGALGYFLGGDMSTQADSLRTIQERQKTEDLARLAAQFGMNTSSVGSPNQVASSRYLSERAPQDVLSLDQILTGHRLQALQALLPLFSQAIGLGTPQRQIVTKPGVGANIFNAFTGLANTAANFIPGTGAGKQTQINPQAQPTAQSSTYNQPVGTTYYGT